MILYYEENFLISCQIDRKYNSLNQYEMQNYCLNYTDVLLIREYCIIHLETSIFLYLHGNPRATQLYYLPFSPGSF